MRVYAFVVTCALAGASVASAQSLADVARKEGERRQEAKPAAKTYTNTDLKAVRGGTVDASPADGANTATSPGDVATGDAAKNEQDGQADAPPADASQDQDAAAAGDGRDSGSGSDTASNAESDPDANSADAGDDKDADSGATGTKGEQYWSDRMSRLRAQLERNETYLNALQSRVNALTADFVNRDDPAQRTQISNERQKALAELQRLEKQIQSDRTAIPELEEEARRAGVPSGWLR